VQPPTSRPKSRKAPPCRRCSAAFEAVNSSIITMLLELFLMLFRDPREPLARTGLSYQRFPTIFPLFGWTHFLAANRFPPGRKMRS
jgi:hypothetical protein